MESNKKIKILIDNGSQAELISKEIALDLGKTIRNSNTKLVTAQECDMQVVGEVDLDLIIAGHSTRVTTQVVDHLSPKYHVILGLGWLNDHSTAFITQPGRTPVFKIDNTEIPIITNVNREGLTTVNVSNLSENIVDFAKCATNLKIMPRSAGFVKLSIPYNEKLLGHEMIHFEQLDHITENIDEFGDNDGPGSLFKLQSGVIKIKLSGNNKIYCHIPYSNLSGETINLKKGKTVGSLSVVEEVTVDYDEENIQNPQAGVAPGVEPATHNNTKSVNTTTKEELEDKNKDYSDPVIRHEYIKKLLVGKCDDNRCQELVEQLFKKYPKLVKCPNEILGYTDAITHDILYDGPKCIYIPPYKTTSAEEEEINEEILKMLQQDLIEASKSGFNLPILVVRKKNGTIRICTDSRAIGKHITKLRLPLPSINELIRKLGPCKMYCVVDLKSAFHQILLGKESRPYTAFRTSLGAFQMTRMAFGLPNAPSSMSALISMVVNGLPGVVAYLDDILVGGSDIEDCRNNLEAVFQRLAEKGLTIAPEKCVFFKESVIYLGHVLSSQGIKQDPEKVSAIHGCATPKTLKDLRAFMGLASYYRKFTRNFADIAAPLTDLTRGYSVSKGNKIMLGEKWKNVHQQAFEKLKEMITTEVTLAFPNFNKPFKLSTDASKFAIGGVLSQEDDVTGQDRPITFYSRRLSDAERNYSTLDKEAFSLIYGLKYNRPFIHGREIQLISDSEPLVYLLKSPNPTGRNARWLAILSEYRILNIKHIPGVKNVVPDVLSRLNEDNLEQKLTEDLPWCVNNNIVNIENHPKSRLQPAPTNQGHSAGARAGGQRLQTTNQEPSSGGKNLKMDAVDIISAQGKYKPFSDTISYLQGKACKTPKNLGIDISRFTINEEILCISSLNAYDKLYTRIAIPPALVQTTLNKAHIATGHGGLRKMTEHLKTFSWWRFLCRDTKLYCENCQICKQNKVYFSPKIPILEHPEVTTVWSRVHIDLIGPLPESKNKSKYILTVIDSFSRFALTSSLPDKKMITVARAMVNEIFAVVGCPDVLYSDRGLEFTGKDFREAIKSLGVSQKFTTSFNPQSNGAAERFNRTLVEILRCLVFQQPLSWHESLKLAVLAYNTSYNQAIKETPYYVFFLRDPKLPYSELLKPKTGNSGEAELTVTDYVSELTKRATSVFKMCKLYSESQMLKRNEKQNVDRKFKDIAVGDRVFIKNNIRKHKLVQRYIGPFRVIGLKGSTVFCYSLANKKHKQITMDKVRYAGDLSQDDAPDLLQAFPEQEPEIAEGSPEASQVTQKPNTSKQTELVTSAGDMKIKKLQRNQIGMLNPHDQRNAHRYSLRSKT